MYRIAAERFHKREKERVQDELSRITTKLPATGRIHDFRNKFLYGDPAAERRKVKAARKKAMRERRRHSDATFHFADHNHDDDVVGVNGEAEGEPIDDDIDAVLTARRSKPTPWWDRLDQPFCQRYFIHHLPTKSKFYKTRTPSPLPYVPVPEELAPDVGGRPGAAGGGGGGGGGGAMTNGHHHNHHTTDTVPPPHHSALPEAFRFHVDIGAPASTEGARVDGSGVMDMDTSMNGLHIQDSAEADGEAYDEFDTSPRTIHKGRGAGGPRGSGSERALSLPPIRKQNLRLSQSSPQLYHG
jgi:hypothetical protein